MKIDDLLELENNFIEFHKAQLKSSGLPEIQWAPLLKKLKNEVNNNFKIYFGRPPYCTSSKKMK